MPANFPPGTPPGAGHKGRLELRGVWHGYGASRAARPVLEDCSLALEPGRLTVLLGPSGAGKSTLLRLVAGYEKPHRGEIRLDGRPVRGSGPDRLMVFQETALFPWLSTEDNVGFGPKARGEWGRAARQRIRGLLSQVGLSGFRDHYPGQLSGGMQRRAELARALANDPALLLLDEPFRGLDAMTRGLMIEHCAALFAEQRRTVLFVTTDVDEAIALADHLLLASNRPLRIVESLPVDLPRPRRPAELASNETATALKQYALTFLHSEAMRAFAPPSVARTASRQAEETPAWSDFHTAGPR